MQNKHVWNILFLNLPGEVFYIGQVHEMFYQFAASVRIKIFLVLVGTQRQYAAFFTVPENFIQGVKKSINTHCATDVCISENKHWPVFYYTGQFGGLPVSGAFHIIQFFPRMRNVCIKICIQQSKFVIIDLIYSKTVMQISVRRSLLNQQQRQYNGNNKSCKKGYSPNIRFHGSIIVLQLVKYNNRIIFILKVVQYGFQILQVGVVAGLKIIFK